MKKASLLVVSLLMSCGVSAKWAAGVATIIPSTPYLGVDNEISVFPLVTYEGEQLTWRGPSLAYKLTGLKRGEPSFSLTLNMAPNQLDTDESDKLDGIKDRDFSFMVGASYSHPLDFATVTLVAETDVTNKHNGQRAVLSFERPLFTDAKRQWMVNLALEVEYLTANYADYYFGVSQQEASNSTFVEYEAGSILQPGISLSGFYQINKKWSVAASARLQGLSDEVKDSPIVDKSSSVNGFVGVIYSF